MDKVTAWYNHPAALLDLHPMSQRMLDYRMSFHVLPADVSVKTMRGLVQKLDKAPAHSFRYKNDWYSLGVEHMATFYEDAVLHAVGKRRMEEWWAGSGLAGRVCTVGAALTFWYSLDGSNMLPDAIEMGMKSTALAEFESVFCLTYQDFVNMPAHVRVIDCGKIMPFGKFKRALDTGSASVEGFIAILAEWVKQMAAFELPELKRFDAVTTFDGDSLWQSEAIPPAVVCGHAAATLRVNRVSYENRNKPGRLKKLT